MTKDYGKLQPLFGGNGKSNVEGNGKENKTRLS